MGYMINYNSSVKKPFTILIYTYTVLYFTISLDLQVGFLSCKRLGVWHFADFLQFSQLLTLFFQREGHTGVDRREHTRRRLADMLFNLHFLRGQPFRRRLRFKPRLFDLVGLLGDWRFRRLRFSDRVLVRFRPLRLHGLLRFGLSLALQNAVGLGLI